MRLPDIFLLLPVKKIFRLKRTLRLPREQTADNYPLIGSDNDVKL
jgi:hypothetical protein